LEVSCLTLNQVFKGGKGRHTRRSPVWGANPRETTGALLSRIPAHLQQTNFPGHYTPDSNRIHGKLGRKEGKGETPQDTQNFPAENPRKKKKKKRDERIPASTIWRTRSTNIDRYFQKKPEFTLKTENNKGSSENPKKLESQGAIRRKEDAQLS